MHPTRNWRARSAPGARSPHEQAVLDAGYPWVRTNMLIPTWQSPNKDPRPARVPDGLNKHGHHGINTHLIVEGDLTISKEKIFFNQNHLAAITLSTRPGAQKELSVAPDEMYTGRSQQGCKFVEGHRSLSPASAYRYMSRGGLDWIDKLGLVARGADRAYILEQLEHAVFETKFDFKIGRRTATCAFKDDNQITRGLGQWFSREWNDPAVQAAKGDLRAVIHPSDTLQKDEEKKHDGFYGNSKSDTSSDVDMDDVEEDISVSLIKAFNEWLPGHLDEV
ncbi:hypothetical protein DHEL01_v200037 [Diaporthe helianthi]|uniref:Uncharacterized protein n=1 Tax=Diaporthe helianthi TaxID=158607 RepID=A0A2P5IGG6_DIAHE|nr:hypothetical protein DHEL01_v200037 [Diaporthe helianthi]